MKKIYSYLLIILLVISSVGIVLSHGAQELVPDSLKLSTTSGSATTKSDDPKSSQSENPQTTQGQTQNIVKNGGFEDVDKELPNYYETNSWLKDKANYSVDSKVFRSGKYSAKIENTAENDSRWIQTIHVKPSTIYKISCWTKTLNAATEDGKIGANISIKDLTTISTDIKGTTDNWEYLEMYGKSGEKQTTLNLTIGLGGYGRVSSGTAWFDDLEVIAEETAPVGKTLVSLTKESVAPSLGDAAASNGSLQYQYIVIALILLISVALVFFIVKSNSKKHVALNSKHYKIGMIQKAFHKDLVPAGENPMTKKDYIIIAALTLVYTVFTLFNLGSTKAPQSFWTPEAYDDFVTVQFENSITLSRLNYFFGIGAQRDAFGKFKMEYKDESGNFKYLATFEKPTTDKENPIFIWKYTNLPSIKTNCVKITSLNTSVEVREIAFFELNSTKAYTKLKVIDKSPSTLAGSDPSHLFDEQDTVSYKDDYLNSMYFDEIYHGRTAYEYLNGIEPYENTHPPLGKILISLGVYLIGMVPFGFRIIGALFGAAMIPAMYIFGKRMFNSTFLAFCSAFLLMFDFMHFAQTRISTIDSFATFFIILMYYFIYVYYINHSVLRKYEKTLLPLILCGVFFGLGSASKWIAIYGSAGLYLLFGLSKLSEYFELKKLRAFKEPEVFRNFILNNSLKFVLFFMIIPFTIYALSYIPYFSIKTTKYDFSIVTKNAKDMYDYHSKLKAEHPFQSSWWEWPIDKKPLTFYRASNLPPNRYSAIVTMGNPAIWWVGIFTFFWGAFIAFNKRDKRFLVILTAILMQYLPWIMVPRIAFIYHYFSIVPFMILTIVYCMEHMLEKYKNEARYYIFGYLAIVFLLFVAFYPVISGMEVSSTYVNWLRWNKLWYF